MVRGKFVSLTCILVTFVGVTFWSAWSYDRAFTELVRYTQLSAWSLAQLELELQGFQEGLTLYRSGHLDGRELNKRYDLAWNRLDIFLNGEEASAIRARFGAADKVGHIFSLIKQHEPDVVSPQRDSPALGQLAAGLGEAMPAIRSLMVENFTGQSAIRQRASLLQSRQDNLWLLSALLLVGLVMLYMLSRETRRHQFLAWNDPLTLLPNRAAFIRQLEQEARRHGNQGRPLTLCLIELNHFKEVNDSLGYASGDALLVKVARAMASFIAGRAYLARIGGDEFALYCFEPLAPEWPDSLLAHLQQLVFEADPAHRVKVSMGLSQSRVSQHQVEEIMLFADIALDNARQQGGRSQLFNQAMLSRYERSRQLAAELRDQLNGAGADQLSLHYQPIIKRERHVLGAEALLRWQHPEYGFINPADIVSLADDNGLGERLGEWIFDRVNRDLMPMAPERLTQLEVSINLSGSMFNEALPSRVARMLLASPLCADQLILELTETIALDDLKLSQHILSALQQLNVRIALDDFGTGWSSFSYLKELHFNKIKIDKSFIQQIDSHPRQQLFVSSITDLAHKLGVPVVAEGVETAAELAEVYELGADEIQGYFYARPMAAADFRAFCQRYLAHQPQAMAQMG
ncbi:putative bifunctional diguanylate cyclase/phosphodiesterase [Aeromonas bivalvium]|uniref:putative bifunctional diguanylate cyclase/phosphodiesterase n=1 Tax=Aeromonas bivalvium TaxID=440079 RepID=UPI0005A6468C|nr:bifunctional diguanylate cyclase/phosphodiesterase [Aeromonas bivalvium]